MAMRFDNFYEDFATMSVAELRQKAQGILQGNKNFQPVRVKTKERGKICKSWWGEAWCKNLERYADYENRIGRGKSYLRDGAVVDLKIKGNEINARVQGSYRAPYKVKIEIDKLSEENQTKLAKKATKKIQDVESLITGNFPEELKDLFFQKDGLFPSPKEIHFLCNCPDWANMCKHIAATLYGVAVRLDDNPLHFFEMRGINFEKFADKMVDNKVKKMIDNANVQGSRIIENADLLQIFGVS